MNGVIAGKLAPIPAGWTATLEHRETGGFLGWLQGHYGDGVHDHWAVVATSSDGKQQMLFDYWGNRSA